MNTNRNQETITALGAVRTQIERDFNSLRAEQPHVLQLALNEAEAIASQTDFPQLLFPALATEKAEAIAQWHKRQRALRPIESSLAFTA